MGSPNSKYLNLSKAADPILQTMRRSVALDLRTYKVQHPGKGEAEVVKMILDAKVKYFIQPLLMHLSMHLYQCSDSLVPLC